jgi:hypothetical protein
MMKCPIAGQMGFPVPSGQGGISMGAPPDNQYQALDDSNTNVIRVEQISRRSFKVKPGSLLTALANCVRVEPAFSIPFYLLPGSLNSETYVYSTRCTSADWFGILRKMADSGTG